MSRRTPFGRLIRSPLVQIGAVAALVYFSLPRTPRQPVETAPVPIRIVAADYQSAVRAWEKVHGAPPTDEERGLILDRLAADEALFRRAMELGLDETPITDVRLRQLSELVGGVDEHGSPQELVDDLKDQEFVKRDPIMKAHLIQTMRLVAKKVDLPSGDELVSFYNSERDRFERPAMYQVQQVYFSSEKRGSYTKADAEQTLSNLRAEPGTDTDRLGDRLNAGSRFTMRPASRIGAALGEQVRSALADAPVGEWIGPLESTYGWHLIRVEHSVPAQSPKLATISSEVLHSYLRIRGEEKLKRTLRSLRLRYGIEIQEL